MKLTNPIILLVAACAAVTSGIPIAATDPEAGALDPNVKLVSGPSFSSPPSLPRNSDKKEGRVDALSMSVLIGRRVP
jgi:hypothetical protein